MLADCASQAKCICIYTVNDLTLVPGELMSISTLRILQCCDSSAQPHAAASVTNGALFLLRWLEPTSRLAQRNWPCYTSGHVRIGVLTVLPSPYSHPPCLHFLEDRHRVRKLANWCKLKKWDYVQRRDCTLKKEVAATTEVFRRIDPRFHCITPTSWRL